MLTNEQLSSLGISAEKYNSLSEEEKLALSALLSDLVSGSLSSYQNLYYEDYEEIPVDFVTFIQDDNYLGKATKQGKFIYDFWKKEGIKIFDSDSVEVALSGCLSGDTIIPLINGDRISIKDLADSGLHNFKVYSYDLETNRFTVGNAVKAFFTGYKPTYLVTFDNGQSIKITGNHKFLTRDKHYKSIDDGLQIGDSIMPFNYFLNDKGYEVICHPQKNGLFIEEPTHRMVMRYKIGDFKGVVHHKNAKKRDNSPENLIKMTWSQHKNFHAIRGAERLREFNNNWNEGKISEDTRIRYLEGHRKGAISRWSNPEEHYRASIRISERNRGNEFGSNISDREREQKRINLIEFNKTKHPRVVNLNKITKDLFIEFAKKSYTRGQLAEYLGISRSGLCSICDRLSLTPEVYFRETPFNLPNRRWTSVLTTYNHLLMTHGDLTDEIIRDYGYKGLPLVSKVIEKYFNGDSEELFDIIKSFNHKIVSIKFNGLEEVYDIEVEKYHNFALEAGIVVHNSIGTGKTTAACVMMAYHMYKLMCMRDPQSFFGMRPGAKITYAFLNNTLGSSYGVGWDTFQSFLTISPWFLKKGQLSGRDEPYYIPGRGFEIIVGSRPQHSLGRNVVCLTGDTVIKTLDGDYRIDSLLNKKIRVYSYDPVTDKVVLSNECFVIKTMDCKELIEIELEDGSIIRCTPSHRFLLKDGTYKLAEELSDSDELINCQLGSIKTISIKPMSYKDPVPVYDVINAYPYNNFLVKTNSSYIVSHNCALLDEVSFSSGQDADYTRSKIMSLYRNIRIRMNTRFTVNGKNYGRLFLVSSKATESSFLEAYIAAQVKKGYPIYVVDKPVWEVKPFMYSGKKFKVAVGNKYVPSRIVPDGTPEEVEAYIAGCIKQGMTIIEPPIEERQAFDQDIDRALQDIAGISTSTVTKAFNSQKVLEATSDKYENPFTSEVVSLGMNDSLRLQDFFDVDKIPEFIYGCPVFIHLDASLTGDRTGLAGVAIVGSRESVINSDDEEEYIDELICQEVFHVGIQPPSDSEISFEKTRQFIYYLKDEVGLNIKLVSSDGFQSRDFQQILSTKGFEVAYTSLDRTPDGYDSLRSALYDKRMILLPGNELFNELTDLERNNLSRKYDHPPLGRKDIGDSLGGAHLDALRYKNEFLFFHPDDCDYEGLNDSFSEEDQMKKGLLLSSFDPVKVQSINNQSSVDNITRSTDNVLIDETNRDKVINTNKNKVINPADIFDEISRSSFNDSDILLL